MRGYLGDDDVDLDQASNSSGTIDRRSYSSSSSFIDYFYSLPRSRLLFSMIPARFDRLAFLDLSLSNVTDNDVKEILQDAQATPRFPVLASLVMNECDGLTGSASVAAFSLSHAPSLRTLSVACCANLDPLGIAQTLFFSLHPATTNPATPVALQSNLTSIDISFTKNGMFSSRHSVVPRSTTQSQIETREFMLLKSFLTGSSTPRLSEICLDGMFKSLACLAILTNQKPETTTTKTKQKGDSQKDADNIDFPAHQQSRALRRLSLANCDFRNIVDLPRHFPKLEYLNLENCQFLREFVTNSRTKFLPRNVDISDGASAPREVEVDDESAQELDDDTDDDDDDFDPQEQSSSSRRFFYLAQELVDNCPHLTFLDISGCVNFTSATLKIIGSDDPSNSLLHSLRDLRLSGLRSVDDEGIKYLIPLGGVLRSLDISLLTELTDAVIDEVLAPYFLTSLEALNLDSSCSRMSSKCLRKLGEAGTRDRRCNAVMSRLGLRGAALLEVDDLEVFSPFLRVTSRCDGGDPTVVAGCMPNLSFLNLSSCPKICKTQNGQGKLLEIFGEKLWRNGEQGGFALITDG